MFKRVSTFQNEPYCGLCVFFVNGDKDESVAFGWIANKNECQSITLYALKGDGDSNILAALMEMHYISEKLLLLNSNYK